MRWLLAEGAESIDYHAKRLPMLGANGLVAARDMITTNPFGWRRRVSIIGGGFFAIAIIAPIFRSGVLWGIPSMLIYLSNTLVAMRAPFRIQEVPQIQLLLCGLVAANVVEVMLTHNYAAKPLVIAFGLFVGAYCWEMNWALSTLQVEQ